MGIARWGLYLIVLAGCQPLYGAKPEALHHVEKHKKPDGADAPAQVKYVDDCNTDFRGDPKKEHPQTALAVQLISTGDTALAAASREKDEPKKVGLVKEAIDKYRNALVKDPFSIDGTLKLAVAYDEARRKGCAIAMLKRLAALSGNRTYQREANASIDSIDSNGQWFKDYRKDAMAAVGR